MSSECFLRVPAAVVFSALLAVVPATAIAQSPADGVRRPRVTAPAPSDFMLGRPRGFFALDSGFLFANTGSDLYDFITGTLTIERKAFNTPVLGGRFGIAVTSRIEVIAGLEYGRSQTGSEYRDFVDNRLLPISQTTSREEWNVTGSVRVALLPTGRRISRFAWIPRTFTPYLGAGGGALKYDFQQYGSFVDAQTRRVFDDRSPRSGGRPALTPLPAPTYGSSASCISRPRDATRGVLPPSARTSWISSQ
jgi:hypothetical protein